LRGGETREISLDEATVNTATGKARSGCMMAAAALGHSERVSEIRSYVAKGLTATADILAQRFEQEMEAGHLNRTLSARVRGRALIDLMQGLLLRAKAGVSAMNFWKTPGAMCPSFSVSNANRTSRQDTSG